MAALMRRWAWSIGLLAAAQLLHAEDSPLSVIVYGQRDANVPGWAIKTEKPAGWTHDCCQYAKAIGVDLVLYQGEWTGEPQRVMVLNVWPRKLPTLDAEWQDDRQHYLQRDPAAKAQPLAVADPPSMHCHGLWYQDSDHTDDAVVFCDPGKAAGIRFSWSMTLAASDPTQAQLLALFKRVVEKSSYLKDSRRPGSTAEATAR